ncbi:MAG: tRNA-(ms[2]io[6]A)-hydroxylase [Flavobacteriales bacterium]|nr:tRNA-(ms[2]io[6]A)-hydroxylase [Flavobacteriales bacterium]
MLGLKLATDPRWVNIAEKTIEEILIDHAFCEQKAATTGISLIVRFSNYPEIVDAVSPVVAEEWGHFRKVLKELKNRGYDLGKPRKDDYVIELQKFVKKGGSIENNIIEALLVCAMIEARSCERFRLLSLHVSDEKLKEFYHEFMVSEAGHYRLFIDLAEKYGDKEYVKKRWNEFLDYEADLMKRLEYRGDRVH